MSSLYDKDKMIKDKYHEIKELLDRLEFLDDLEFLDNLELEGKLVTNLD